MNALLPSGPPEPPHRADALLAWFCVPDRLEEIQGDLHELFYRRLERRGLRRARRAYWLDVARSFRPSVVRRGRTDPSLARGPIMWKNYLKISLRNLKKHRGTAFINIGGLALGMACCLVILTFVRDELAYDRYHEREADLYRLSITSRELSSGDSVRSAPSPILWAPALVRDEPDVVDYARFVRLSDPDSPWEVAREATAFPERGILHADASALTIFSWPLLSGDPETALAEPGSVVLAASTARKYFGDADPMGQTLSIDPKLRDLSGALTGQTFAFTVTGVLKDIPRHSHFTFDLLLPISQLNQVYGGDVTTGAGLDSWFWRGRIAHTYLLLREGADPAALEARFPDFIDRYLGDATTSRGYVYEPFLQRIDAIYLDGQFIGQLRPVGDADRLVLFSIIALFLLLVACINYMNLATARSSGRAREVGLRKVVGARRRQIVSQFLSESVVISLVAFVLALGLARLILPVFYAYLEKPFALDYGASVGFLLGLLIIGLAVGVLAGSYPAFFLSRFTPSGVLKGAPGGTARGGGLRKGLVVFQFAVSTFLIIATLVVFDQLRFMRAHDLGFDQERVLVLTPPLTRALASDYEVVKAELLQDPRISDVTGASAVPGQGGGGDLYVARGAAPDDGFGLAEVRADYNFAEMFGLEFVAGRDFSRAVTTDAGYLDENGRPTEFAVLLNEEAVRRFGWSSPEEALGRQIVRDPRAVDFTANVVGVVKDFHVQSLHEPIAPLGVFLLPEPQYLAVKIAPGDLAPTIAFVEETARRFAPEMAFSFTFLDETFAAQYPDEEKLAEVFGYVAFLAIFIACLGLFGLAAFTAERRTKEIGIRKVLGASLGQIVALLSAGYAKLVLLALVVAVPLGYAAMHRWLEGFAYRTDLSWTIFVTAGLAALGIALLTVSYQSIRAALANPVESLRYE